MIMSLETPIRCWLRQEDSLKFHKLQRQKNTLILFLRIPANAASGEAVAGR